MKLISTLLISILCYSANAKLNVVTTTTTLKNLVEQVGQDKVDVISITKSNQDPHFVEAKPSYMVKMRNADLVVAVGFDLEIGWLPNVLRGTKNPKLLPDMPGYLSADVSVQPIEKSDKVDRSLGDIHAKGNPHFHLDPIRTKGFVLAIAERLSALDSKNSIFYKSNAEGFNKKIDDKMIQWQQSVVTSKVKSAVTYHKTLNYFLDRFKITLTGNIEPKPGVPPSAKHFIALIKKMKTQNTTCILNESFFEDTAAKRLSKATKASVQIVLTEVKSNYLDLIDELVNSVKSCQLETK